MRIGKKLCPQLLCTCKEIHNEAEDVLHCPAVLSLSLFLKSPPERQSDSRIFDTAKFSKIIRIDRVELNVVAIKPTKDALMIYHGALTRYIKPGLVAHTAVIRIEDCSLRSEGSHPNLQDTISVLENWNGTLQSSNVEVAIFENGAMLGRWSRTEGKDWKESEFSKYNVAHYRESPPHDMPSSLRADKSLGYDPQRRATLFEAAKGVLTLNGDVREASG